MEGDVVVYYEGNNVKHSTTIYKNIDGLGEYGKNSFDYQPKFTPLGTSWENKTSVKAYREIK